MRELLSCLLVAACLLGGSVGFSQSLPIEIDVHQLLIDKLVEEMGESQHPGVRVEPKIYDCDTLRGQCYIGTPVNSSFSGCYQSGTHYDFWWFSATAGQELEIVFSATNNFRVVALQDYDTGVVVASSSANLSSGSFRYTAPSTKRYVVSLASYYGGSYNFVVREGDQQSQADLAPHRPTAWSDKIVVSTVTGTSTDATTINAGDPVYIDIAFANIGEAGTGEAFYNTVFLDGTSIWQPWTGLMPAGYYAWEEDRQLPALSAGTHTLEMFVDAGNLVDESNENNNRYGRTFTVNGGGSGSCVPDTDTVCLQDRRFKVEVTWRDPQGGSGSARSIPVTADDSAIFWFFDQNNWEMLVKVLDGCAINDRYWVFTAASTNVEYHVEVTDTQESVVRTYSNPQGTFPVAVGDTSAFDTCP